MGQDVGGFGGRAVVRAAAGEPGCALARGGAGRRRRFETIRLDTIPLDTIPHHARQPRLRGRQDGGRELYDPGIDPHQLDNLTGTRPEEEANLCARLQTLKVCVGNGCKSAEGP